MKSRLSRGMIEMLQQGNSKVSERSLPKVLRVPRVPNGRGSWAPWAACVRSGQRGAIISASFARLHFGDALDVAGAKETGEGALCHTMSEVPSIQLADVLRRREALLAVEN